MLHGNFPRIVIAGLSGDSGKTIVSCGLISSLVERGIEVSAFKKGPDYIDAAWLSLASGKPARNLDTYLMGFAVVKESFLKNASSDGINIIEGNRGLFDGVDVSGTHSTAELAKLLQAPIVIVQDISKVTRTAAASILGCIKLDPAIKVAGVILNRAANERHARVVTEALHDATGIPVLGSIPRLSGRMILPSRHLGLIMPGEFERSLTFLREAKAVMNDSVDIAKLVEVAGSVQSPAVSAVSEDSVSRQDIVSSERTSRNKNTVSQKAPKPPQRDTKKKVSAEAKGSSSKLKIAYFKDEAFSFYYPENLEMLEAAGAELIPVSSARGKLGDGYDALYIGGGFPEMNLMPLVLNREMIDAVKDAAEAGMPVYAECGGLIYLAEKIEWNGDEYPLSGVLPVKISMHERPQGHGYCEAVVDKENPFFDLGTVIKGHEFHYSNIVEHDPQLKTSFSVSRGTGSFDGRDGLTYKNVFASYIHMHATSSPEWVRGMIRCARNYRDSKNNADRRARGESCKEHDGDYALSASSL